MPRRNPPIVDGKKQCKRCSEWLPLATYYKIGRAYSTLCRSCQHLAPTTYYKLKDGKRIRKKKAGKRGHLKDHEWRASKSLEYRLKAKGRRRAEKQKMVMYKGGKCIGCSYNACIDALDFHHLDPSKKDLLLAGKYFDRCREELDKCVLLCCRCHREVHAGLRRVSDTRLTAPVVGVSIPDGTRPDSTSVSPCSSDTCALAQLA